MSKNLLKAVLSLFLLTGCASAGTSNISSAQQSSSSLPQSSSVNSSDQKGNSTENGSADPENYEMLDEDGIYDTKEEVALYLYEYHKLPENFMTKTEARKQGWESGALNQTIPGKCIGGDVFGNYEGVLPEDADYHECDIGTLNSKSRGAKRIVYSDNWDIYYTEDHYETFELLYEGEE